MRFVVTLFAFLVICISFENALSKPNKQENASSQLLPNNVAVDEVVVESSLYIKPKPRPLSRTRLEHRRIKREPQFRGRKQPRLQPGDYAQSQAAANAAANDHAYDGFGNANSAQSNAIGQAFQSTGAAGSFGASSAGSVSQTQQQGLFGGQNSAGISHAQTYTLPNGQTINFGLSNSFANGPFGNNANSRGSAVSVSQG